MKDSFWTSHHQSHRHDCTAAIAISSALSSWLLLQQQVELKTSAIPRSQSANQTSIIHLCRRLPCNGHHQISPYLHCNYKQMRWSSWSHLLLPVFKILEICLWFVFFFLDETGIKEISSYGRWRRIYHQQLMISSKLWRLELVWFVFPSWVRQESRPHFQLWQATDSIASPMNDILQMVRPNEFCWQEWNVGSCTPPVFWVSWMRLFPWGFLLQMASVFWSQNSGERMQMAFCFWVSEFWRENAVILEFGYACDTQFSQAIFFLTSNVEIYETEF